MTDFKGKIGAKEALLDVQVIVLPLLSEGNEYCFLNDDTKMGREGYR